MKFIRYNENLPHTFDNLPISLSEKLRVKNGSVVTCEVELNIEFLNDKLDFMWRLTPEAGALGLLLLGSDFDGKTLKLFLSSLDSVVIDSDTVFAYGVPYQPVTLVQMPDMFKMTGGVIQLENNAQNTQEKKVKKSKNTKRKKDKQ